ncbi:HIBADH family dehydrogenase [Endozoicomonas gorgoniicola]|uniref:hypothetical protein n=1 Tax=Endozoicomonas gorgoniicola TaxID=1234144 RepID=UPI00389901D5
MTKASFCFDDQRSGQTQKSQSGIVGQIITKYYKFASKAGADPVKIGEALMGGFVPSRILEVHGERIVKGTFDPGLRLLAPA